MPSNKKVLLLPGDGIGPEVTRQAARVLELFGQKRIASFEVKEDLVGGAALDRHKLPLTDATLKAAMEADAVLLGAVGGPKWDNLPFALKPERGLLRLRKDMELFANLRPAFVLDDVEDADFFRIKVPHAEGVPVFALHKVSDLTVHMCSDVPDTQLKTVDDKTL